MSDSQRIGYLAASQCFHEGTDVIMLTTNQIRKVGGLPAPVAVIGPPRAPSCHPGPTVFSTLASLVLRASSE